MADAFTAAEAALSGEADTETEVEVEVGEEAAPEAPTEDTPEEPSDAPEVDAEFDGPPSLDLDEFGDYLVTIKVDGEERQVPIRELQSGYMRQADYTKKTQGVAADRQKLQFADALQSGLASDPYGTLQALAQHYGITAPVQPEAVPEFDDPLEARLYETERQWNERLQRVEQTYGQMLIDQEIASLSARYEDFAEYSDEIIAEAIKRDVDLTTAYKLVTYDKKDTAAKEAELRAQRTAAASAAKRKSQVVSSGKSSAGKVAVSDGPRDDSMAAALEYAEASLNRRR